MRYRITGTDQQSRSAVEMYLEAPSDAAAWKDAAARGIIVKSVEPQGSAPIPSETPLLVRIEPGHVQLIERTHKFWKGLLVLSALLCVTGLVLGMWLVAGDARQLSHPSLLFIICLIIAGVGLIGMLIARIGAWWYHG